MERVMNTKENRFTRALKNIQTDAKERYGDYMQIVRDNKKELIRGSVLDPDNHPSYDKR